MASHLLLYHAFDYRGALMKRDFRDAVFGVLHGLMKADPSIMILCNDAAAWKLDEIRQEFPERAINVGVAEQNMMSLAAGLASAGKKVFVYGIIAHLMRGWEQIKVGICIPNLPVTILGMGAGLSSGLDGPTHHAVEDVALMRVLANMTIYNPADCVCAEACVRMAYEAGTPHYIRLDKDPADDLYRPTYDFSRGYAVFGDERDDAIVATGIETQRARRKYASCVIDVFRLKPAPDVWQFALSTCEVWDEHHPHGGLWSMVAEQACLARPKTLQDEFILGPAKREPVTGELAWVDDGYGMPFRG
jgi:transketolase